MTTDRHKYLPSIHREQAAQLRKLKRAFEGNGALSYVVLLTLREAIMRGILKEGYKVRDETLARILGLSRTPCREALHRLEAEGLLVSVPRLGLIVAELTPQDVENIYTIRASLEGLAARLAAERATAADIAVLEDLLIQFETVALSGNVQLVTALTIRFHKAVHYAGRNPQLAGLLSRLRDSVQRFNWSTFGVEGRAQQVLAEHRQLLEAIKTREPDVAEEVAKQHMENAKQARLAMFPSTGMGQEIISLNA